MRSGAGAAVASERRVRRMSFEEANKRATLQTEPHLRGKPPSCASSASTPKLAPLSVFFVTHANEVTHGTLQSDFDQEMRFVEHLPATRYFQRFSFRSHLVPAAFQCGITCSRIPPKQIFGDTERDQGLYSREVGSFSGSADRYNFFVVFRVDASGVLSVQGLDSLFDRRCFVLHNERVERISLSTLCRSDVYAWPNKPGIFGVFSQIVSNREVTRGVIRARAECKEQSTADPTKGVLRMG